jgi:hypothetical protein
VVEFENEKKSLIIDDWGAIEGAAGTDGRRARRGKGESREKKLRRIEDKRRRREGLLWLVVEEDCQLGCSAKVRKRGADCPNGERPFPNAGLLLDCLLYNKLYFNFYINSSYSYLVISI